MKQLEQAMQQNFIQLEQDTSISIKYVPCHAQDMQAVIRLTLKNHTLKPCYIRRGSSNMENRVYCLYRVSTMKQADFDQLNHANIPMQRNACHEFAAQMGWNIVHEEQETGVSGFKISAENRDKLQLIKNHAVQKKFDILLVFMFNRIGRKADESPFIVE